MNEDVTESVSEPVARPLKKTKEKPKTYWKMWFNIYRQGAKIKCLNEEVLLQSTGHRILGPPNGRRGFPDYTETPKMLIDTKLGKPPADLELFHEFWFVSAKAKSVFETIDRDAFAFCKCETVMLDGAEGPEYWLCDVLPVIDAIDDQNSKMKINIGENGYKWYTWLGIYDIKIKSERVGDHKIFRPTYASGRVFCDDSVKSACKALTNIRFYSLKNG